MSNVYLETIYKLIFTNECGMLLWRERKKKENKVVNND